MSIDNAMGIVGSVEAFTAKKTCRRMLLARRARELLLTTALACIPFLTLSTPTLAAEIGDIITNPAGDELTVTEQIPNGVIAEDASGNEYRIMDIPAIGSIISFPTEDDDPDEEKTVAGYYAGNVLVTQFKMNATGWPVTLDDQPITGIAFGTPASDDDDAIVTSSLDVSLNLGNPDTDPSDANLPGQTAITDVRRAANGKNGRAGALSFRPNQVATARMGRTSPTMMIFPVR